METEYDRIKRLHPKRLWWEERKLAISEWWYGLRHRRTGKSLDSVWPDYDAWQAASDEDLAKFEKDIEPKSKHER